MTRHYNTYLALGDSYTIGEALPIHESFPYQAVQLLRKKGYHFHAPEIVAKTGWTTSELAEHLLHTRLNEQYDFVTLLIGVNNQYRGLSLPDYISDLEFLARKALQFAGGKTERVIVVSIPDWGVTPFAAGKDAGKIAAEIDRFNQAEMELAEKHGLRFIDITTGQRSEAGEPLNVAGDKLHPSGREYARWAAEVAAAMEKVL